MAAWITWNRSDTVSATTTADPWPTWCVTYGDDATCACNPWPAWTQTGVYTVTTGAAETLWAEWVNGQLIVRNQPVRYAAAPPETEEQRAARVLRAAEVAARRKQEDEERKAAEVRARELLQMCLDAQQKKQLQQQRFFEVVAEGSRKRYRVKEGTHGNVVALNENDEEEVRYCIQPPAVPTSDAMLAQKLMLETDEQAFLRIANATRLLPARPQVAA